MSHYCLTGKDFICIQSMDGTLSVFEQESFAFSRFLPGALLPGPIRFVQRLDSFVTVSSQRQVESYKYAYICMRHQFLMYMYTFTICIRYSWKDAWYYGVVYHFAYCRYQYSLCCSLTVQVPSAGNGHWHQNQRGITSIEIGKTRSREYTRLQASVRM